ncbi:tetratricopeptide repeat protein [uncultured Microscilla sp.]|uniref:tetratricopeptide repeat protein n=1 Tax=uncultured Microscilla sp. TaxID=432653 RepID=UPI0026324546|nr:tetratricopeptide repeat protein [uncultured Microscilla sp.]
MRHIILLLCLLWGQMHATLQAQSTTDSLLTLARQDAQKQKLIQSLRHYLKAVNIVENTRNSQLLSNIYIEIGKVYQSGRLHQKALKYFLRADSLNTAQKNDQDKPMLLGLIGGTYQQLTYYTKALNYFAAQVKWYKQRKQPQQMIQAYRQMVVCHQRLKQYPQVLEYNKKILTLVQQQPNKTAEIATLNNIGFAYKYLNDYPNALKHFKQSLEAQRVLGTPATEQLPTQVNIAITYQNQGRYNESIDKLLQAIKVAEKAGKNAEKAQLYDLLALVYYYQKDYYNALQYNEQSIEIAKLLNDRDILQAVYKTSSLIHQKRDDYEKALNSFRKHLSIKDSLVLEESLKKQALAQQKFVVERAEKQIKLIMAGEEIKDLALKQQQLEIEKKNKEFELLEKEKKIQDAQLRQEALAKQQALQKLQLLRQKATAAQKDKEIVQLQAEKQQKEQDLKLQALAEKEKQKQIQILEKDKKIRELDLQKKNRQIAQQSKMRKYFMGITALGFLVLVLILIGLIITRRANKQLSKQKNEIEEKNTELFQVNEEIAAQRDLLETKNVEIENINQDITSSIVYAQRIQEAMLPSLNRIQTYLPQSFVLFKPRDIVSGDFYWFSNIKPTNHEAAPQDMTHDKLVFAAVDCTGHGVPGALMSMTGNNLLNEIVEMRGADCPSEILRLLHKGVKKALKQDETNNRDGMDMALCVIDRQKKEVNFAGAKNPLIYINNGKLHEIKGDKTPIGGEWGKKEGERLFTKHCLPLNNDVTTFYMFSDGYQDQFGGPEGKKFMKGHLKKLLLEIHQKPMKEQKQILETTIIQWMERQNARTKEEPQLDDILVVGFRVEEKA